MFALGKGKSTGQIVKSVSESGAIINTTHYSVEECRRGLHYHENPHLCFLLQGSDTEMRGNRSYQRRTGEIYFYFAGENHASTARAEVSKNINIEFEPAFLKKFECTETQIARAVAEHRDAKFLILKIRQETVSHSDYERAGLQALLLELVSFSSDSMPKRPPEWVRTLTEQLNDKWNESVSLQELSEAAGVHPTTVSKHFRRYFSCTLGEYLRKLKVEKSLSLIKNSRLSLTDIALHCGFADQSHFTRTFKQLTGFLPKDFRNI